MVELGKEQAELEAYFLSAESLIFVVGGYEGKTAEFLANLYGCQIYAFEPVEHACYKFRERLNGMPGVRLFPFALGDTDGIFPMAEVGNYGGSFLGTALGEFGPGSRLRGQGEMRNILTVVEELGAEKIDLLHMNIEGYEYYLLPYMLATGLIERCRYLMIQFHLKFEEAKLYDEIRERLESTHHLRWDAGSAWSSWERK